ncbi:MAG: PAS domain-containing protein [Caldilineaceae bacterium]
MMALLPTWHDPAGAHEKNITVLSTGQALCGVIESYEKNGVTYWVSVDQLPSLDEQGDIDGLMLFIYDITPLKDVEKALRFQKTLLEAQSETSLDGIWVVSSEQRSLSYNQRFLNCGNSTRIP